MGWGGGRSCIATKYLLTLGRLFLGVISKSILEHLHEDQTLRRILGKMSEIIHSLYNISVRRDRSVNLLKPTGHVMHQQFNL